MNFKLNFNQNNKPYCFLNAVNQSFAACLNNPYDSNSFGILKKVAFAVFVILYGNIGTNELFGQKAEQPDAIASVSGAITCINPSVKLIGSSKTLGVYYTWSGPGGYTSTAQRPMTGIPGDYTLTVTNPVDNTSASSKVKVLVDTVAPVNVKANVSGLLTCKDTLVILTGSSSSAEVTYSWNGPGNYTSSLKSSKASIPGFYKLTVTHSKNGCISTTKAVVKQNTTSPSGVVATVSGILNCKVTKLKLTGTSKTKDVIYNWSGPGFKSSEANTTIAEPGLYQLKVTDLANGCTSTATVNAKQEISLPEVKILGSDTLTCKILQVKLTASSSTSNVNYEWSGPNGYLSTEPTLETNHESNYTLTVSNPDNGCFVEKLVKITKDTIAPKMLTASVSGALSCDSPIAKLSAKSLLTNAVFDWAGPQNFKSNEKNISVKFPGNYMITATNPENGCASKTNVTVTGIACTEKH